MCASCGAELKPEWKFCITCGEPVVRDAGEDGSADAAAEQAEQAEQAETAEPVAQPEPTAQPEPVEHPRFNILAILALVLACIGGAPALVFGHVALGQIKETHERGRTIAIVATALGYLWLVVWIVGITLWITGVWR